MAKVLVTGIKTYSFTKEDGEVLEGAKVSYIGSRVSSKDGEHGFLPIQANVKLELAKTIKEVPGIYNLDFEMTSGKNNKPELMIVGFDFIKEVDMYSIFEG